MGPFTSYYHFYRNKPRILLDYVVLLLLHCVVIRSVIHVPGAYGYQVKPRSFFHRYQDCVVRLYSGGHVISSTLNSQGSHENNVTAEFTAFGRHFVLDLSLNRQLLSGAYVQKVFHEPAQHSTTETNDISHSRIPHSAGDHCFYHGRLRGRPECSAAVSTCDGLRGYIMDRDESYHLERVQGNVLRVYRGSDQRSLPFKCGTDGHDHRLHAHQDVLHRHRRSAQQGTPVRAPYDSNAKTRYVELYLVSDYRTYERHGKNSSIVIQRSKDIANIVSSLYRKLNIYVVLVGVEIWSGGDLIRVTTSADNTMENFLRYRMKRINPVHHNDNAQLITGVFFDHGVVGKAIKGPICTHQFSGGVNMDYGGVVSLVATTVAHEMGHNFGMEHDNDTQCSCLEDKCIMSATSGKISPKGWSSCSHTALAEAFHLGMDYCLRNVPQALYDGPVCGNGLMEDGEECDCGLPKDCTSQCCDPHTCRMYPLAQCATGKCCNLRTCQYKPATSVCRAATGECDLPEFCNGTTEFCPSDVFDQDGRECLSGQSYCYQGRCATHTNQCKMLWGESGRVSDPICFQQLNMKGDEEGSCGYDWNLDKYTRCYKEDVMCGLLHCVHLNEKLMFWRDNLAIAKRASFLTRGNTQYVCRSAMLDVGLDMADPGFAGDGVKCEHNKICLKQRCVALAKLNIKQCPQNCYGHGRCNSEGNCHCDSGYAPPLCNKPGSGGSIDSGPTGNKNDDNDKLVALLVIFLLVLPLVGLVVLIFCCRTRLKPLWHRLIQRFTSWAKCKNRKPKPIPPAKDFDTRVSRAAQRPKPPIFRDKQVSNPLLVHQEDEKNSNKSNAWRSKRTDPTKSSVKDNAPPIRPPPPPCPPSLARSGSKSGSKKVRLSTPIQETQGPPSKGAGTAVLSSASEDESPGPVKIAKRESFRGSQISSPVLVCTTNRDSLVLADGNVDIIGPEALASKPSAGSSVKRSQSERTELSSVKPSVTKSASVRASLGEETPEPMSASGFRPRPVPPLPSEEEEDDTQPIYTNQGLGMGDLLSEIEGSLFKAEEQPLYNNLPIQETAPPCPPRPDKYRPSSGRSSVPTQETKSSADTKLSQSTPGTTVPKAAEATSTRSKTPTRQSSLSSRSANNDGSTNIKENSSKNSVNELRQKILSRSNFPKEDAAQKPSGLSGPKGTADSKPGSDLSSTSRDNSSTKPNVIPSSTPGRPSPASSSVSQAAKSQAGLGGKKPEDSAPSVSSLKAKFNQTQSTAPASAAKVQKNTSNISGSSEPKRGVTSNAAKSTSSFKSSLEKTVGQPQSGPKAPTVRKGLPEKSSSGSTIDEKRAKVAELKAALNKNQGQSTGTTNLPIKPVPQVKAGVKHAASERSGTVKPAASGAGRVGLTSDQPQRPVLPPKPGETVASNTTERSVPKAATRTPGTTSQPKRVQSFKI